MFGVDNSVDGRVGTAGAVRGYAVMRRTHRYALIIKAVIAAILALCVFASAQSPLGLQYPLGIPDLAVPGAAAAMGGSGTAVADEFWGMGLNPANAAIGERSAFSALVSLDMTTVKEDGASPSSVSGYSPKLLSLIIPIGKAGNVGFAMQKRYDANLNFYTKETEESADGYGTKTNTIEFGRKGGLTAWQAGWAYRFGSGMSVGLLYEKLYYNRESRDVFESLFDYPDATYRAGMIATEVLHFESDGIRFGMQVPVHSTVTLGVAAEYIIQGSDNGLRTREYFRTDAVNAPLDNSARSYSVTLPPSINIGAAYAPNDHWLFAADAHSTLWEAYTNDLDTNKVQRVYGLSAGGRFIPSTNRLSAEYWEKIHYSAGLRYTSLPHYETSDGAREYAVSLGLGLPIPNEGGIVDIAIDIGRRTDDRYKDRKYGENTIKIQLGINGGRNWFQRE